MNICRKTLAAGLLVLASLSRCVAAITPDQPPAQGLVFWLDASDATTIKCDDKGRLSQWRSKVGDLYPLRVTSTGDDASRPLLIEHAINEQAIVRFGGHRALIADGPIRMTNGPATVFAVFQRSRDQSSDQKWQRLVSAQVDSRSQDTQWPNFCITADGEREALTTEPTIVHGEFGDVQIGTIAIGGCANGGNLLHGDIAEVLVYDRSFLSEGEQRLVLDYLHAKWKAAITETGWTRTGELGPVPPRTRQDLPLSDQANQGGWTLDHEFTDEFDAPALDLKRWHLNPTSPGDWTGRQPALFAPSNVEQKDGMLHLTYRKEDVPEKRRHEGYASYTSALIRSNARTGFGYYEIRARPMPSAASSAFWFADTGIPDQGTELDVFETGAKAKGFERKYNMNAHVWKTPQESRHWAVGGVWNAPWNLGDDFHTYGFDWSKEELIWYVDGVVVRRAKNTNWLFPMQLMFDTEAMFSWFGKVDDADLPSTFSIDYVRVWRHSASK